MKKQKLTEREKAAFTFIEQYVKRCDYPPTVVEVGMSLEASQGTAEKTLVKLADKGYIERTKGIARGIRIL